MSALAQRAIHAYSTVDAQTSVASADPHKLIVLLYDGALRALANAKLNMARGEIAAKGENISKAIMIVENGLKVSLDIKAGGELAERLAALYDYMCHRLLDANLHNRSEVLDEVRNLLVELRGAWAQISPAANRAGVPVNHSQ